MASLTCMHLDEEDWNLSSVGQWTRALHMASPAQGSQQSVDCFDYLGTLYKWNPIV